MAYGRLLGLEYWKNEKISIHEKRYLEITMTMIIIIKKISSEYVESENNKKQKLLVPSSSNNTTNRQEPIPNAQNVVGWYDLQTVDNEMVEVALLHSLRWNYERRMFDFVVAISRLHLRTSTHSHYLRFVSSTSYKKFQKRLRLRVYIFFLAIATEQRKNHGKYVTLILPLLPPPLQFSLVNCK